MKRMFLPVVLASIKLMASHVSDQEIQKRMADLHERGLYPFIRAAQHHYRQSVELAHNEQKSIKSKLKLATCCYLLKEECEAKKLWQEVVATGLCYSEAHVNLKELYYRWAIDFYDVTRNPGLLFETREKLMSTGKDYAQKALEPSELYTLDQEKIKQLTTLFKIQGEE